jgi:hypothetical protein
MQSCGVVTHLSFFCCLSYIGLFRFTMFVLKVGQSQTTSRSSDLSMLGWLQGCIRLTNDIAPLVKVQIVRHPMEDTSKHYTSTNIFNHPSANFFSFSHISYVDTTPFWNHWQNPWSINQISTSLPSRSTQLIRALMPSTACSKAVLNCAWPHRQLTSFPRQLGLSEASLPPQMPQSLVHPAAEP